MNAADLAFGLESPGHGRFQRGLPPRARRPLPGPHSLDPKLNSYHRHRDLRPVAGRTTAFPSPSRPGPPQHWAATTSPRRLRRRKAGAILEHRASGTTEKRLAGTPSGGAGAALIAGLCSLATGSDGGGSIRIPASFCGVYGIKPTQLRVPRYGSVGRGPATANLFSQSGPMSRTVKDSAILLTGPLGPRPPGPHVPQGPRP